MKRVLKTFLLGILAGIAISFGGLVFLFCKSEGFPILGSFLFSVGLLIVCSFGLNLYTGKIGYVLVNKKRYLLDLLIMYIGNFVGAVGTGLLMKLCNCGGDKLKDTVEAVSNNKLFNIVEGGKPWYYLIIMGFFCGVLVFLAVDMFKKENIHPVIKVFILIGCVGAFVASGFEHCVADMFYFGFSGVLFSSNAGAAFLSLLFITIGNSIGSIAIHAILYLLKDN